MMKSTHLTVLFSVLLLLSIHVDGIPMVENSVKFALERCKQFLHLATFLQPNALVENAEIRRTKKVCDHIVLIEADFESDEKKPANVVETAALKQEQQQPFHDRKPVKRMSKSNSDDFGSSDCQVQLFQKQDFLGGPVTLAKSVEDVTSLEVRSLRVIGDCSWRFFNQVGFQGRQFTISGDADMAGKERRSPSSWGWTVGELRSVKRVKASVVRRKRDLEF